MNKNLLLRACLSAVGVFAYIGGLVWFMNNAGRWFHVEPQGLIMPVLALMVFIVSACITGSLVLLKPILLYSEGNKKDAVQLFGYTVGFLILIALLVGVYIISVPSYPPLL